MRIIQALAEQHPETSLRTNFGTMKRVETYETTISCKEEIGVRTIQTGKGVERGTIHSDKDGRGETRLREEFNPMNIVVIGHDH
jgi:hypothetical protein